MACSGLATVGLEKIFRVSYRIRLLDTGEGWSVSCLDLPGCHSQGETREEALQNIREAIGLWLEVEAEESGVKRTITRAST
jgi:predicted RNase H-like HicB family nuclease